MTGAVPIPLPPSHYHMLLHNFSTVYLKINKKKTEAEEAPPGEPKVEETPAAAAEKEAVPAEPAEPVEPVVSDLFFTPPPRPHLSRLWSW